MDNYYPKRPNPVTGQIPDNLPDYTKPIFTPKDEPEPEVIYTPEEGWLDDEDYTHEVAQGINDILNERPQLTRSEAEEQMHLTELRRLAEGYTESDAMVISEVLSKNYPVIVLNALGNEMFQMKYKLDAITGEVNEEV